MHYSLTVGDDKVSDVLILHCLTVPLHGDEGFYDTFNTFDDCHVTNRFINT